MSSPPKPTGSGHAATFMQKVWDVCFGPSRIIRKTSTVTPSYTPEGIFLNVNIPAVQPVTAAPASADWYTLVQPFGTYCVCRDSTGAIVRIAKPFELWNTTTTQTIYGQVFNYTYPHDSSPPGPSNPYAYVHRTAVISPNPGGAQPSVYLITPPYICAGTNGTPATRIQATTLKAPLNLVKDAQDTYGGTFSVTLMEMSSRAWSLAASQSI